MKKLPLKIKQPLVLLALLLTHNSYSKLTNELMNRLTTLSFQEWLFFIKVYSKLNKDFVLTKNDKESMRNLYKDKLYYKEEPKQNWFDSISILQWISLLVFTIIVVLPHI